MATTTYRALRKPTDASGVDVATDVANLADDADAALQAGGAIVCTSSTRPASPTNGALIYETDTGHTLRYKTGTGWRYIGNRVIVADATARAALTTYAGLQAFQTAQEITLEYDGTKWSKVPGVPSMLYSIPDMGTTGPIAPGGSALSLYAPITIPAHQPGPVRAALDAEVVIPSWTVPCGGFLQLNWGPTNTALANPIGERVRWHGNSAVAVLSRHVEGTFYSDGAVKYLYVVLWNDPASGSNVELFSTTMQVQQL